MRTLTHGSRGWLVAMCCLGLQFISPAPGAAAPRPAAAPALHVVPFPGTPDAAPSSDIIFSSLQPSEIDSVSVIGSRSGGHRGRLVALPDGAGTVFMPDRPFTAPERVSVTARLGSPAAGTASGDPGAAQLRFSFGVAAPTHAPTALLDATLARSAGPPTLNYVSAPGLHPPVVNFTSDHDHHSGDIFLTPTHTPQVGPLIFNGQGHVVWFSPQNVSTFNLEVQHYQGHPVLTWWQGDVVGIGYGAHGQDVIMNRSYRTVAVLHGGNGYSSDLHEFQITPEGTALIDAYVPEKENLSSVGGPTNGTVLDCVIQELSIKTGQVLWEWHALGHIPLSASYRTPASFGPRPYDYFHLNSIEQLPDGNLMISGRNTWSLYKINRASGKVMWVLGGKDNTFHLGPGTNFSWQHDAHIKGNVLTVFDDAWDGAAHQQEESESSAKEFRVNIDARTATLIRRFTHSPPLVAGAEGSAELLGNRNVFVGWGSQPDFSEYGTLGKQILNASLPVGANTYRAYRFKWNAQPATKPALALVPVSNGALKVYASWNGATQVASWHVLGGPGSGSLGVFDVTRDKSFETEATLHSELAHVEVQAVGAGGQVLGTSTVHATSPRLAIFAPETFARATGGSGQVAVGCYTGQTCHLRVRISSGKSVLAQTASHSVAAGTGTLIPFQLSSSGRSRLARSSNHRLSVAVTVSDSVSNRHATATVMMIPYSIAGAGPERSASPSPTIRLATTTGFVSSTNAFGQILTACYATTRACQPKVTIRSAGKVIASTSEEHLGAEELGDVYFKLTKAGQTMLSHAHGNQLAAQITLTDGGNTATGQIALVHYR